MTDWFDPSTWLRPVPDPMGMGDWWSASSSAWLRELTVAAENRPVEVRHGATVARGTLRSLELQPVVRQLTLGRDGRVDAFERIGLTFDGLTLDGHAADELRITVPDVRLETVPAPRLRAGAGTFEARLPLATVSDWLAQHRIDVAGADARAGSLRVEYRRWRVPVAADVVPGVTVRGLVLSLRTLTVRNRRVRLPQRFDIALSVPLELPHQIRLADARIVDPETVEVTGQIAHLDHAVTAQQILDRLRAGTEWARFELG